MAIIGHQRQSSAPSIGLGAYSIFLRGRARCPQKRNESISAASGLSPVLGRNPDVVSAVLGGMAEAAGADGADASALGSEAAASAGGGGGGGAGGGGGGGAGGVLSVGGMLSMPVADGMDVLVPVPVPVAEPPPPPTATATQHESCTCLQVT